VTKKNKSGMVYVVEVRDDEGKLDSWHTNESLKDAEARVREMEETRGYDPFNFKVKTVPGFLAAEYLANLVKEQKK
jgi:hypothetical protein